jgi:hypothetical protein
MKLGLDVAIRFDEYREPIRRSVDLTDLDPSLQSIDWHVDYSADGQTMYRRPATREEIARQIMAHRDRWARLLAHEILKGIGELDTENGYTKKQTREFFDNPALRRVKP